MYRGLPFRSGLESYKLPLVHMKTFDIGDTLNHVTEGQCIILTKPSNIVDAKNNSIASACIVKTDKYDKYCALVRDLEVLNKKL